MRAPSTFWHSIFSIANQLRYGIVLLVGISLLLTSGALIQLSTQAQIQQIQIAQNERSQAVASTLQAYVSDLQRKIGYLARVRGLSSLPAEFQSSLLEGLTRHNDAYEFVAILDRQGKVKTKVSPYGIELPSQSLSQWQPFVRAFRQQEDFVDQVELVTIEGNDSEPILLVTLSVPIRDRSDQVDGVLVARVNLKFLRSVIQNTRVGNTGYAYVVDNRNIVIADANRNNPHQHLTDISDRPLARHFTTLLQGIRQNNAAVLATRFEPYMGLHNVRVLGSLTPIEGVNWAAVVEMPTLEVYAPLRQLLLSLGISASLALVTAALIGVFFSRRIISSLQALIEAASHIQAGNLEVQVVVKRSDELGLLAYTFNQMTLQLRQAFSDLQGAKKTAETTLKNLQSTQAQLVQSEKLSSLGQMVAGIAHEINNPVNFIHGNTTFITRYTHDLFALLALYQQQYAATPEITAKMKAIDFEYLQVDLFKILASMTIGTERIRDIVTSLRSFSRLDEAEVKNVDIHEGIDSTLMILNSRLKAAGADPAIEVIKKYGDVMQIECYAGQLNQVFMNILSNAIDALRECPKFCQSEQSEQEELIPFISIQTEMKEHHVVIRIEDNGTGIPSEIQNRIFDPFFTTKPVGKGTGLGMSISYQIVTEKHRGTLTCISRPDEGTEFVIQIPVYIREPQLERTDSS
jgi:signal transduction histidine kinase